MRRVKLKGKAKNKADAPRQDESLPVILLAGQTDVQSRWVILLLAAVTWVISLPMFAPWGFWPVGYVVFVPWLLAIALASRSGWAYLVSYLLGAAFYLMHFRWLYSTTPEGYLAASLLYVAPLFVPVAWVTRHLHRERGWPLAFVFPLAWTAQELLHSRGPLAFPWFLLGHTQYRFLSMIQIADLAGVYGVSLVLAAVNGLVADLLLRSFFKRRRKKKEEMPRKLRLAIGFGVGLPVLAFLYGQFRLHQGGQYEGPKVAVLQGDFPLFTHEGPDAPMATETQKRATFMRLANEAADAAHPDLIVFPETPWTMYLNSEGVHLGESLRSRRELAQLAADKQVSIVIGGMSIEFNPDRSKDAYPKFRRFNSAFLFRPEGGEPARYDKINLVLFGEYVPFRYSFHALYTFLNEGPWIPEAWRQSGSEYSLDPGREYTVFASRSAAAGAETSPGSAVDGFGITICYEDVIPEVFRRFILDEHGAKRAKFMLNISNDGWFGHGTQQAQHLVNCAFRAVENRVSVARSVNTGISGFIQPDGSWRAQDLVQTEGRRLHAGGTGWRAANIVIDPRVTLYSRYGDLLPAAWSLVAVGGLVDAARPAWRTWGEWRKRRKSKPRKRKRGK